MAVWERCSRTNVGKVERWMTGASGAGLAAVGWRNREHGGRYLLMAGGALVLRAATGFCPAYWAAHRGLPARWNPPDGLARDDTKRAPSAGRGITLKASVRIERPVPEVYAFWRNLRNLPQFMAHLEAVEPLDDRRSRWVVRAPARPDEWTAEIVHEEPDRLIGWRSLPDSQIVNAGSVNFRPVNANATGVSVSIEYRPPAGEAGAAIAALLGTNPSQMLCEDLVRLKGLLEAHARQAGSMRRRRAASRGACPPTSLLK
jgi:uncharacterized membrane protein